ncbi:MAG: alpha/beta fold hydrolase [Phototrophicaceae bacterium]
MTTLSAWVHGHYRRESGSYEGTQSALYRLTDLRNRGMVNHKASTQLLQEAGLTDFTFQLIWADDGDTPDRVLEHRLETAEGVVVFVHGWTGSYRIWESLPGMVVTANPKLVALCVDHNGFGNSRFEASIPPIEKCDPPAAMKVLQRVIDLLRVRRDATQLNPRVINFVGHSMGGAVLFFLNPMQWGEGEVTRYALAPALLLEDELHQAFYTTLGTGINLLQRLPVLEFIERVIQPRMIDILCNGASHFVKQQHTRQYMDTRRGVTGATFRAMGLLKDVEIPREWKTFRVILGHKDNLVGLTNMMDLLGGLEFPVRNIRVVPGSHYMFSVADATQEQSEVVYQHVQSRQLIVEDILDLHDRAYLHLTR